MILTNCWKIYKSFYDLFLSSSQKKYLEAHKEFLKTLIELLFLYNSEEYAETVSGIFFKEYPQYSYIPHKSGLKPQFLESIS